MSLALAEARLAAEKGEVPVGAVIVHAGALIAKAHNQRETLQDPTAHAEILALTQAAEALGSWRLLDTTLYVTLEPCPMCAGALLQARVARLVFGAKDPKGGGCGSVWNLLEPGKVNHSVSVEAGVLAGECAELLQAFFQARRRIVPGGSDRFS
jgi:tRNA(adenine34) deaminase